VRNMGINLSSNHLRITIITALSSLRNKSYRRAKLPDFVIEFIKNEWKGSKRKTLSEAIIKEMRVLVAKEILHQYQASKDGFLRVKLAPSSSVYLLRLQRYLNASRGE
jgi:hypothetical protein